jgi:hypothetical protein
VDDVEAGADGALAKDLCVWRHFSQEHAVLDVVELFLREVVEDEMVLEAVEDEGLVRLVLGELQRVDALLPHPSTDFVQTHLLLLLLVLVRLFHHREYYGIL